MKNNKLPCSICGELAKPEELIDCIKLTNVCYKCLSEVGNLFNDTDIIGDKNGY